MGERDLCCVFGAHIDVYKRQGVLAEDKLFATLDLTSRAIELPDGRSLTLVDTVGLIRRLPHHLVEAVSYTHLLRCDNSRRYIFRHSDSIPRPYLYTVTIY